MLKKQNLSGANTKETNTNNRKEPQGKRNPPPPRPNLDIGLFDFMENWDDAFQFTVVFSMFILLYYAVIFLVRKATGN